mmetsp:Transcript_3203/g.9773  ORF Transcript_3203/g.9773 Transcript_3203/m.9773 type:complete len:232 (+) Transcript_3203:406-1101(+)
MWRPMECAFPWIQQLSTSSPKHSPWKWGRTGATGLPRWATRTTWRGISVTNRELARNVCANRILAEKVDQCAVRHAPVHHDRVADTTLDRVHRSLELGDHPTRCDTAVDQLMTLREGELGHELALTIENACNVSQEQKLRRLEGSGDGAGHRVRIDVERLAISARADWCQHRRNALVEECPEDIGTDVCRFSHKPQLRVALHRRHDPVVPPGQPKCAAARLGDGCGNLLVD